MQLVAQGNESKRTPVRFRTPPSRWKEFKWCTRAMKGTRSKWKYKNGVWKRMKDSLTVCVELQLRCRITPPMRQSSWKMGCVFFGVICSSNSVYFLNVLKGMTITVIALLSVHVALLFFSYTTSYEVREWTSWSPYFCQHQQN